jgi:hypothetical protein
MSVNAAGALLDISEAERFLNLVWPGGGPDGAYLVKSHVNDGLISEWTTLPALPRVLGPWLEKYAARFNTYYAVGLRDPRCEPSPKRRGGKRSVCALPGFVFDADDLRGSHKQDALPLNEHETIDFFHTLPWAPSLIVDSGGGMHGYWLFEKPFLIEPEQKREAIEELSKRFRTYVVEQAKNQHGWHFDTLSQLDIILRLPGSLNHKTGTPVPVTLIHQSGERYTVEDFERDLPPLPLQEKRPQRKSNPASQQTAYSGTPTGNLDIMTVAQHYGAEMTLKSQSSGEWEGAHPQHGSTTGDNFNVQPDQGVWHCFRCDSGGSYLHLIAVGEGLIPCEDARSGVFTGNAELYHQVVKIANERFGAGINWRPARRVVMRGPIKVYNVSEVRLKTTSVKTR